MGCRPAKNIIEIDETILIDQFGKKVWDLKSINKKTGKETIIGSSPCGRNVLREMMNKYNLRHPLKK